MRVLRKLILWATALLGASLLGHAMYLDSDYATRMPRTQDLAAGRTVPLSVQHGTHVFVTPKEAQALEGAQTRMWFGWPLVMFGLALVGADHIWQRREKAR
jgi:hypothetical protein